MKGLLAILAGLLFSSITNASEPYDALPEKFIELVKQNKQSEAVDIIFSKNKWIPPESDQIKTLKSRLSQESALAGAYKYHELIDEQKLGTKWSRATYAVGFERQPIIFVFDLYKPDDHWIINTFSYHTKFSFPLEKLSYSLNK